MADFDTPFANTGDKTFPTPAQSAEGFECGPANRALFNGLFNRIEAELGHLMTHAGIDGDDADLTQVRQAVAAMITTATANFLTQAAGDVRYLQVSAANFLTEAAGDVRYHRTGQVLNLDNAASNQAMTIGLNLDLDPYIAYYNQAVRRGFIQMTDTSVRIFRDAGGDFQIVGIKHAQINGDKVALEPWANLTFHAKGAILDVQNPTSAHKGRFGYGDPVGDNYISLYRDGVNYQFFVQANDGFTRLQHVGGAKIDLYDDGHANLSGAEIATLPDVKIQQVYESGLATIASGVTRSFSHGFGVKPLMTAVFLECVVNDSDYVVGDEIQIDGSDNNSAGRGYIMLTTTTQVQLVLAHGGTLFQVTNKAGTATVTLTHANWRLKVKAISQ